MYDDRNLFVDEEDLDGKPTKEDRILAALCYVHFLFLVPFLMQKDTDFLKFHMSQGGLLYVLFVFGNIVFGILLMLTGSLRFMGLGMLIFVLYTGICVFAGYRGYMGDKHELKFLKASVDKIKNILDKKDNNNNNNDSNY